MNRRTFLKFNALGFASASMAYAMDHSKMNHGTMEHSKHNIHNMNTSFIEFAPKNLKLLNIDEIPSGKKLAPLTLLKNESKEKNFFRATIEIAEEEIEIAKGKKTKCYTYNKLVPGSKIEAYEGDTIEILVKNKLNEATTIHWHGMPVPPNQDGNPHDPILAGEERIYRFTLPIGSAGTYWYHPHPHYTTSKQVFKGLAGVFVVKAKKDALSHLKEQDWVISDLRLDEKAQIPNNTLADWLNGREGEIVLINGQLKPKIEINNERIRIYNLCAARYLNLRLSGAKFVLVGTDGGLIEKPVEMQELFLSPASRAEVLIKSDKKGEFKLESAYYDRDKMMVKESPYILHLADIDIKNSAKNIPQTLRKLPPLEEPKNFKEIIMSEDHHKMHGIMKKSENEMKNALASMFLLNGKVFDMKRIDERSKLSEMEDWIIINKSHMDHPFHIHGTQFELISSKLNGVIKKAEFRALRDTINVRPNEELRLRMKQDFVGLRMYHCHILEHEDLGMMASLEVYQ